MCINVPQNLLKNVKIVFNYFFPFSGLEEATKHLQEMEEKTLCRNPVPVVLRIRDISSSPNREYFPQCTIVHRCRKDSGCCNETSVCAPKSNTTISKYFLVSIPEIKFSMIWFSLEGSHQKWRNEGEHRGQMPLLLGPRGPLPFAGR